MTKKKKTGQHYVWKRYLKSWALEDKIFRLRDGEIIYTNPFNIAKERDFYRLKEIDAADIEFVKQWAIENSPSTLKDLHLNTLEQFTFIFQLKFDLEKEGLNSTDSDNIIDSLINNIEEDIHNDIENSAINYMDLIKDRNIDFYEDSTKRISFLVFLCFQYFRTNKIRLNVKSKVVNSLLDLKFRNQVDKTFNILSHIFAYNMAYFLAFNLSFHIVLILNKSNILFITGDQPVVNTFSDLLIGDNIVEKLELYYPVSPHISILITNKTEYIGIKTLCLLQDSDVYKYNSYIFNASHKELYSNSQEILESYRLTTNCRENFNELHT